MKILVLEENEHIVNIYKKLFGKKDVLPEFARNESEFLDKFSENFDYYILENPFSVKIPIGKIQNMLESEKFINLSSFIKKNENFSQISKETKDIVEKPFAMIAILVKLEISAMKNVVAI